MRGSPKRKRGEAEEGGDDGRCACNICGQTYTGLRQLRSHRAKRHPGAGAVPEEGEDGEEEAEKQFNLNLKSPAKKRKGYQKGLPRFSLLLILYSEPLEVTFLFLLPKLTLL